MCARPPAALALLQLPCLRLAFGSPEACKLVLRRPPFNLAKKHIKPFATPSLRPALVCWPAAAGLAPSHPVPNPPNREPAARPTEPPMLPPKPAPMAPSRPHRDEPCRNLIGSAGRPANGRTSARVVATPGRPLLRPARRRQLLRTSTDVFRRLSDPCAERIRRNLASMHRGRLSRRRSRRMGTRRRRRCGRPAAARSTPRRPWAPRGAGASVRRSCSPPPWRRSAVGAASGISGGAGACPKESAKRKGGR